MYEGFRAIREVTQGKVPVLVWNSAALGPGMRIVGPEDLGGMGDLDIKAKELAAKTGRSLKEAEYEVNSFLTNWGSDRWLEQHYN